MASVTESESTRKACRITEVKVFVVGMRWRNCVFAHVATDEGIKGIGEGSLEYQPQAVAAAIEQLVRRYVIGQSAFSIERVFNDILRNEFMRGPIINSAIAAVEMAMWDIVGKALDRPIYDLLGGRIHEALPAYANAWYGAATTPADMEKAARAVADKGYRGLKFDPFGNAGRDPEAREVHQAIDLVAAVRQGVGPGVDVLIDAHGRFSVGAAIDICRKLEPFDLYWMEEPVDAENAGALAAVGRGIKTRLATGERCTSRYLLQSLLATNEVDVLQPDIIHVGGILEGKKIAAIADSAYIPVSFHNPFGPVATAAAIQLDVCTSNFVMQESFCEYDVPMRFDLLEHAPRPRGGRYEISDRPGLGVGEFRPEIAEQHPFEPDAFLPLFRRDWAQRF